MTRIFYEGFDCTKVKTSSYQGLVSYLWIILQIVSRAEDQVSRPIVGLHRIWLTDVSRESASGIFRVELTGYFTVFCMTKVAI
jgi:hypothetical protein